MFTNNRLTEFIPDVFMFVGSNPVEQENIHSRFYLHFKVSFCLELECNKTGSSTLANKSAIINTVITGEKTEWWTMVPEEWPVIWRQRATCNQICLKYNNWWKPSSSLKHEIYQ